MYEQRIDHASHYQGRIDTKTGRIYRIAGKGTKPAGKFDLGKETREHLVERLSQRNKWFRQTAQEELLRRGPDDPEALLKKLSEAKGQTALELLWAANIAGNELMDSELLSALEHSDPSVRLWTVRLACDRRKSLRRSPKNWLTWPIASRTSKSAANSPVLRGACRRRSRWPS